MSLVAGQTCRFLEPVLADYWRKGETSGHIQKVREVPIDYDADTMLGRLDQVGLPYEPPELFLQAAE